MVEQTEQLHGVGTRPAGPNDSHLRGLQQLCAGVRPVNPSRSHYRLVRKLQDALGVAICAALEDISVVEIMLNPDGRLFVERLGQGIVNIGELEPGAAEIIIGSVAHALQTEADTDQPIISGELPIGGHRFEGLLPPVVAAPTFTIRRRASRLIPLDDYVRVGIMTRAQVSALRAAITSRARASCAGLR